MPTALLTGITGQTGSFLAEHLLGEDWTVVGAVRPGDGASVPAGVTTVGFDLGDPEAADRAVAEVEPDTIFNLGGLSSVARSWEDPNATARITGLGPAALLAAAWALQKRADRPVAFVQASSAEIFGQPENTPQTESTPVRPVSPYGAAKAYAHHLVGVYRGAGMPASSAILYNHESSRRPVQFVTRKITRTVAAIALGLEQRLVLGDLEARRDWGWAPDYARALAAMGPLADDFVVATGSSRSVRDFVAAAFAAAGIEDWGELVQTDDRFRRPQDPQELVGDSTKLRQATGWQPTRTFEEMVAEMVATDIAELSAGASS